MSQRSRPVKVGVVGAGALGSAENRQLLAAGAFVASSSETEVRGTELARLVERLREEVYFFVRRVGKHVHELHRRTPERRRWEHAVAQAA